MLENEWAKASGRWDPVRGERVTSEERAKRAKTAQEKSWLEDFDATE